VKPYYSDASVTLYQGKAEHVLPTLPDASVDSVVTDPPYGLEFMGREWDSFKPSSARLRTRVDGRTNPAEGKSVTTTPEAYVAGVPFQRWCEAWSRECLRILKPGGHLLAFGGTRTVHRLTCAIEDAGFEIRDGIDWLYGSGFPKSLNVGDGRGTALKPAREPIVVARRPLAGTVAANVLAYGTGALNIDATRVDAPDAPDSPIMAPNAGARYVGVLNGGTTSAPEPRATSATSAGRWPSNVVLSHASDCGEPCVPGCPVAELDRQSGDRPGMGRRPLRRGVSTGKGLGYKSDVAGSTGDAGCDDAGGASRFFPVFRYEAKAPTAERPRTEDGTAHPTVKPLDLMRWLVRLVTPPGGTVLEPFAGSGTTAEACVIEGYRCIAIEREAAYLPLITARLSKPIPLAMFGEGAA
jgi:DNA modification methylase